MDEITREQVNSVNCYFCGAKRGQDCYSKNKNPFGVKNSCRWFDRKLRAWRYRPHKRRIELAIKRLAKV